MGRVVSRRLHCTGRRGIERVLIHSLRPRSVLSFGPDTEAIPLREMNVIIGPNGSGKSNLLEVIALLKSAPRAMAEPIREGGGIRDWLWKGSSKPSTASLEATVANPNGSMSLRYRASFIEQAHRFQLVDERIENEKPYRGHTQPYFYYGFENNQPVINIRTADGAPETGTRRVLRREDVDPEQSILSQRKDPDQYPELTYLGETFARIRLYREWSFGRYTLPRMPQKADLPNDVLDEDARNLGLILNRLRREPSVKRELLNALKALYEDVTDFDVIVEGGTVQVVFQEGNIVVPAMRLSDGTLRYLCLLAVLCDPSPPPLVCIEEPELGLHPDVLPTLADMLVRASERTQIVITTHSDALVDAFTVAPESVLVCEKVRGSTVMRRLDEESLSEWLHKYSLGQLWRRGELGANRW